MITVPMLVDRRIEKKFITLKIFSQFCFNNYIGVLLGYNILNTTIEELPRVLRSIFQFFQFFKKMLNNKRSSFFHCSYYITDRSFCCAKKNQKAQYIQVDLQMKNQIGTVKYIRILNASKNILFYFCFSIKV